MKGIARALTGTRCVMAAGRALTGFLIGLAAIVPAQAQDQAPAGQEPFTFALIGDLGYSPQEEAWTATVFAELNKDPALSFIVHVGDLSSPRFACTDELLERRREQFRASAHPLVYTPGDNEWTDCHEPTVIGGDPLARLIKLRAVLFEDERSFGQRMIALARQSTDAAFAKYRENVRWDLGGVTFLTLHIPGSNNGLGRTPEGDAEYADRNKANLAWLQQGFAHAKAQNSRSVMVLQQANIFPEYPPFPGRAMQPSGFADIRAQLQKETLAFGKPVVLVHGDSHYFRIDKPMSPRARGPVLENFTRVETFGSPYHHWLHVTVDPSDPNVFTFRPRMVPANIKRP